MDQLIPFHKPKKSEEWEDDGLVYSQTKQAKSTSPGSSHSSLQKGFECQVKRPLTIHRLKFLKEINFQ
jgi:hypothetical protein